MNWVSPVTSLLTRPLTSLITATPIAARAERGQNREVVRRQLHDRVASLQSRVEGCLARETGVDDARDLNRFKFASAMLNGAESLSRRRRRKVRQSITKLVGIVDAECADALPYSPDENLEA